MFSRIFGKKGGNGKKDQRKELVNTQRLLKGLEAIDEKMEECQKRQKVLENRVNDYALQVKQCLLKKDKDGAMNRLKLKKQAQESLAKAQQYEYGLARDRIEIEDAIAAAQHFKVVQTATQAKGEVLNAIKQSELDSLQEEKDDYAAKMEEINAVLQSSSQYEELDEDLEAELEEFQGELDAERELAEVEAAVSAMPKGGLPSVPVLPASTSTTTSAGLEPPRGSGFHSSHQKTEEDDELAALQREMGLAA